jgi:hypothetical protein
MSRISYFQPGFVSRANGRWRSGVDGKIVEIFELHRGVIPALRNAIRRAPPFVLLAGIPENFEKRLLGRGARCIVVHARWLKLAAGDV